MSDTALEKKDPTSNSSDDMNNDSNDDKDEPKKQAVLAPLPLEWTKMASCPDDTSPSPADTIRYPWDVMELPDSDTDMKYLEIVGTSGQKVTRMGSDLSLRYPNIESLVLRSHLIRTMDGLAKFRKLEVLELYDNMIDELRDLNNESGESAVAMPSARYSMEAISPNSCISSGSKVAAIPRVPGHIEMAPPAPALYSA